MSFPSFDDYLNSLSVSPSSSLRQFQTPSGRHYIRDKYFPTVNNITEKDIYARYGAQMPTYAEPPPFRQQTIIPPNPSQYQPQQSSYYQQHISQQPQQPPFQPHLQQPSLSPHQQQQQRPVQRPPPPPQCHFSPPYLQQQPQQQIIPYIIPTSGNDKDLKIIKEAVSSLSDIVSKLVRQQNEPVYKQVRNTTVQSTPVIVQDDTDENKVEAVNLLARLFDITIWADMLKNGALSGGCALLQQLRTPYTKAIWAGDQQAILELNEFALAQLINCGYDKPTFAAIAGLFTAIHNTTQQIIFGGLTLQEAKQAASNLLARVPQDVNSLKINIETVGKAVERASKKDKSYMAKLKNVASEIKSHLPSKTVGVGIGVVGLTLLATADAVLNEGKNLQALQAYMKLAYDNKGDVFPYLSSFFVTPSSPKGQAPPKAPYTPPPKTTQEKFKEQNEIKRNYEEKNSVDYIGTLGSALYYANLAKNGFALGASALAYWSGAAPAISLLGAAVPAMLQLTAGRRKQLRKRKQVRWRKQLRGGWSFTSVLGSIFGIQTVEDEDDDDNSSVSSYHSAFNDESEQEAINFINPFGATNDSSDAYTNLQTKFNTYENSEESVTDDQLTEMKKEFDQVAAQYASQNTDNAQYRQAVNAIKEAALESDDADEVANKIERIIEDYKKGIIGQPSPRGNVDSSISSKAKKE